MVARFRDNSGTTEWNVTPFSIVISKGDTVKWIDGVTSGDYTFFIRVRSRINSYTVKTNKYSR